MRGLLLSVERPEPFTRFGALFDALGVTLSEEEEPHVCCWHSSNPPTATEFVAERVDIYRMAVKEIKASGVDHDSDDVLNTAGWLAGDNLPDVVTTIMLRQSEEEDDESEDADDDSAT